VFEDGRIPFIRWLREYFAKYFPSFVFPSLVCTISTFALRFSILLRLAVANCFCVITRLFQADSLAAVFFLGRFFVERNNVHANLWVALC